MAPSQNFTSQAQATQPIVFGGREDCVSGEVTHLRQSWYHNIEEVGIEWCTSPFPNMCGCTYESCRSSPLNITQ
ncbi:hypothetical protein [Candidatus Poriferisocius sp.]|uniref:hypothetical protein n=1 Tax=Candidatus Poriferisocius sp. TaxID=3101276 RepID=UPI003B01A375